MAKYAASSLAEDILPQSRRVRSRLAREDERLEYEIPVKFRCESGTFEGVARNASVGGLYIETPTPAKFGETIQIEIDLPGLAERALLTSFVRWTKPEGMGVQFDRMGARETYGLMKLLMK